MDVQDAERLVTEIIREIHGGESREICSESDLFGDLGIDGDDAADVFEAIRAKFGVDLSSMKWDRHFGPEVAFCPFALLLPSWWRWRRERVPVRVRHLAEAVLTKRWSMDYGESEA